MNYATLLTSIVYLCSGTLSFAMGVYFIFINDGELRKILIHLFLAWSIHYLFFGLEFMASIMGGKELMTLAQLRYFACVFVLITLTALIRLYRYTRKLYG